MRSVLLQVERDWSGMRMLLLIGNAVDRAPIARHAACMSCASLQLRAAVALSSLARHCRSRAQRKQRAGLRQWWLIIGSFG
jgi:hypothetical protein